MDGFLDEYLPDEVPGYPCVKVPRTHTSITAVASGQERRRQLRDHALNRFVLPVADGRCWDVLEALNRHWLVTAGPVFSFPFRDPFDFASRDLVQPNIEPTVLRTDQVLGVGDGTSTRFQMRKRYTLGSETYSRLIQVPVVSSILVGMNALAPTVAHPTLSGGPYTFTVEREGGIIEFDHAPAVGMALTWGGYFDIPVRFDSDETFEAVLRAYQVGGFSDMTLVEVPLC